MCAKFREFKTSSGKIVLAGKDAEQNEQVISQVESDEIVLHTESAGSPFTNIKGKATKQDIKEASIFCAKYSREWKQAKIKPNTIKVHYFKGKEIFKSKSMKTGTFGVKKVNKITVNKKSIETLE